jgi:CheY-like chemotaxis protein
MIGYMAMAVVLKGTLWPYNGESNEQRLAGSAVNDSPAPKPCILIVEDEVLVRMFAVDALEDEGFQVEECATAAEALAKLRELATVTAAIVDLGLPDRPGDELAIELRKIRTDLPIVIASGRSERELKERFALDHRLGIVVKPYTGPMLLNALQDVGVTAA